MTQYRNNWAGHAVGTTPTTATSGGASGDEFTTFSRTGSHTAVIVDSPFFAGGKALRVTSPSGATGLVYADYVKATSRQQAAYALITIGTPPSVAVPVITFRNSADGVQATATVTADNRVQFNSLVNGSGSTSAVLPAGEYLVSMRAVQAEVPTTSNGQLYGEVMNWETKAKPFEYSHTAASFGVSGNLLQRARFIKPGGTGSFDSTFGPVGFDDNAAGFMVPPTDFVALVAPGLVESPAGEIDVTLTAIPGATAYDVQRALGEGASPDLATVATIRTGLTSLTFSDPGRNPSTKYWYRYRGTN